MSKCRLPWDEWPPLRPASEASWRFREKLRFSSGTLRPPLRAISRCLSASMDAKPRFEVPTFFRMVLPLIMLCPANRLVRRRFHDFQRPTQIWSLGAQFRYQFADTRSEMRVAGAAVSARPWRLYQRAHDAVA